MAFLCLTVAAVFFSSVPFTSGPSGRTGRPLGASMVRCWHRGFRRCRRGCRRLRRRVAVLLGVRIRGGVRIRARVRIRVQNLVLSEMAGVGRRAIAVSEAGPVSAAMSAADSLPRSFSLRVQVPGLARRIPA
jgi:hypothetical protein